MTKGRAAIEALLICTKPIPEQYLALSCTYLSKKCLDRRESETLRKGSQRHKPPRGFNARLQYCWYKNIE